MKGVLWSMILLVIVQSLALQGRMQSGGQGGRRTGEGFAGEANGFSDGGEVGLIVAGAGVEIVEVDLGYVERVGAPEGHSASSVARMRFQQRPSPPNQRQYKRMMDAGCIVVAKSSDTGDC